MSDELDLTNGLFWSDVEDEQDAEEIAILHEVHKKRQEIYPEFKERLDEVNDINLLIDVCDKNEELNAESNKKVENTQSDGVQKIRKQWGMLDRAQVNDFDVTLPKDQMAMEFPYELDDFQKRAILRIEKQQNVLCCAHTGCGKTTIAEYAIAYCAKRNLRAVYTSPIKALSNQKFHEFSSKFDSVGILTGDVSINRDAQCVIMTTEILRNMLYVNDPSLGSIGAVIFDEIHYISNAERGVVWEECLILIPKHITLVMLSATIQNIHEFACWIGDARQEEVFYTLTQKRVVPLTHYLFFRNKPYLLLDKNGHFNRNAYPTIYADLRANQLKETNKKSQKKNSNTFGTGNSRFSELLVNVQEIIRYLDKSDGFPVCIFCFSRASVDQLAEQLAPIASFDHAQKSKVNNFIDNAIKRLDEKDRNLPQINFLRFITSKGIGAHHSGMLPIAKEIVEILVAKKLLKVLIATETFAMGINMPMRSVVLSSLQKHDTSRLRSLKPSEYIQMAGRAGRRGFDDCGQVYILSPRTEPLPLANVHPLLSNPPFALQSQFNLSIAMVLDILTRSSLSPTTVIGRSFMERVRLSNLAVARKRIRQYESQLQELQEQRSSHWKEAEVYCNAFLKQIQASENALIHLYDCQLFRNLFTPGSCFKFVLSELPEFSDPAVILTSHDKFNYEVLLADIPVEVHKELLDKDIIPLLQPATPVNGKFNYLVLKAGFKNMFCFYNERLQIDTSDFLALQNPDNLNTISLNLSVLINELTPQEINVTNSFMPLEYITSVASWTETMAITRNTIWTTKPHHIDAVKLELRINALRKELHQQKAYIDHENLQTLVDFRKLKGVLQKFGFVDENDTPTLKGRAACELIVKNELALPELIFSNLLTNLTSAELVATAALFCGHQREILVDTEVSDALEAVVSYAMEHHETIGSEIDQQHIGVLAHNWQQFCNVNSYKVAYLWATNIDFVTLRENVDIDEGTLAQIMLKTLELLRKCRNVSYALKLDDLKEKFEAAIDQVKRGVLFTESLYLSMN